MDPHIINLLSRRQRGKFASCWLAATSSEASFKKYYNSVAIKRMNVVEKCDEILEMMQSSSSRPHERFNLYLSSQLMYGIMKIHSYQLKYYEKEVFEFEQNLNSSALSKKKGNGLDDFENITYPENIELPKDISSTQILRKDLHILPGEDPNDMLQIAMPDMELPNFGCLNDEELELFLSDDISLDLRKLHISEEKENISEDMTIPEKVHRFSSQEVLGSVLVDISKKIATLTPQKRQPQIQPETPTKRRRLSFETTGVVPPADVAIPVPEKEKTETLLVVPPQSESDMEKNLESLNSSFMIYKSSKKSKIIDKKIALTDEQLRKWRQDVKIRSKQSGKFDKPIERSIPAINLLKEPSYSSENWNTSLRNLFFDQITGPVTSINEDVASAEVMKFQDTMLQEETISKIDLPTGDTSKFVKTDVVADSIVTAMPMVTANVSVQEVIPHVITLEGISTVEDKQNQEKVSNIDDIDESLDDINILLERRLHSSKPILGSPAISSGTSQPELTSQDILAQLEVFWLDEPCVKFSQLIPKDTFTREDAAVAFNILLELHAQKKLILQQAECFRTLRIWKKE